MVQTRTVTILFCDLVGSTALMTRLGDDANDRVRRRLFVALREAVAANRGEEVKSGGDGMMVAFPASAADAVSCAVAMQRAVSRLGANDPLLGLAMRVGLSSGEASNEDNDWFGVPVVEANRLENAARTGQILCADVSRILVGSCGGHTFTPVGPLDLKGLPEPLAACEVAWEPDPGLLAIPLPSGLARGGLPFAGRAAELATLQQAWEDAIAGERRFVLIKGEQGIGKTRLAAEFAGAVHGDGFVVLYGRSETDREVPYQPFAEALRWYVLAGQPQDLRVQVGAGGGELTRIVPALRLRLPDLPEPRAGDPAAERQALFDAVLNTLSAVAQRAPVLLVVDDLEQAGAPTLALLRHLVTSPERPRLLIVGLAGDVAGGSPWAAEAGAINALPGCIPIALAGLAVSEVDSLLGRVEGSDTGLDLAGRIHRETEGSPRFVTELIARLHESGGEPEAVLDAACPYMGLRSFEAADSGLYFGRDEVIGAFLGRLGTNRLLSVVGASGSGKSSLARAGLVPRLRNSALPGSGDWEVLLFTPGAHPLAELASRLGALAGLSAASILRDLEADPRTLDLTVSQALADRPASARVLVVADQFEELFTLCRDDGERQRFIDALLAAIGVPGGRTMAILAMRADFYGEAARYPGLAGALELSHALLGPMTEDDLRLVIERPAAATGLRLDPGLSDLILRDVGDEPGGLPLLSHALLETWKRRDGRTLTAAGYMAAGGVRGAIAQTAETVYGSLAAGDQAIARNLFVRLTELGEGTEDTRRRVAFTEVVPAGAVGEAVRGVITRLADARLLTTSADSVEVAHEALIREWPRLREWLDDDREGLRLMRHLTESAHSWQRLGRDEGELYRGTRLAAAVEWAERTTPELNPFEREFLEASRELHQREEREAHARARRLRLLATAASGLFVVAAVVGGLAAVQWRSADQARQRSDQAVVEATLSRLEAEVPLLLKTDRGLAFALAAQAHNLQPGPRTDSLLNLVLGDDPRYLGRIFPSEPTLSGYGLSPDGKYIALRTTSGLLELYDATTRILIQSIRAEPATLGLSPSPSFLPDGKSIVNATYDPGKQHATLVVRDVPTLAEVRRFEFPAARGALALSPPAPDGRLPAVVNGVLHLLDLVDGTDRTVTELPPLAARVRYDPRGRYLAAQPVSPRDTLGLFDARTFALLRTFPQQTNTLAGFMFTPDGNLLILHFGASSEEPGRVDLWNPETGELLATAPTQQLPGGLDLASNGARVAVPKASRELGVLSLPGLDAVGLPFPLLTINLPFPKFGAGHTTIYNHALVYALEHWDLSGAGLASAYTAAAGPGEIGVAPDGSWFVKQSPDGHWSRWRLPALTLIDRSTTSAGETTLIIGPPQIAPAVSSDGKYFATGHSDCPRAKQDGCAGSVVIWEAATGRALGQPIRVPNPLTGPGPIGLAFHPDLPLLAIHGNGDLVIIVTLEGGAPRIRGSFITTNTGAFDRRVDFLPSAVAPSATIITKLGPSLSVWDVSKEVATRLGVWETASIRGWAVTPAGTVALLRSTGDLQFFRYEELLSGADPEPLSIIPNVVPFGVPATLRFSADGRTMSVTRNVDGKVALWDLEKQASIGSSFA